MSVEAISCVWHHSRLNASNLFVLIACADYADDNGICWPSIQTLAKKCRMSERNMRRCIDAILESGELVLLKQGNGRYSSRYQINFKHLRTFTNEGGQSVRGDTSDPLGGTPATPYPSKNRQGTLLEVQVMLPPPINTPEIEWAWIEWKTHLKQKRIKLTDYSERQQIMSLADMGPARALTALKHSVKNNYQGIYEPKRNETNRKYPTGNTGTRHEGKSANYAGVGEIR